MYYTLRKDDTFHYVFKSTDNPNQILQLLHRNGFTDRFNGQPGNSAFWSSRTRESILMGSGVLVEHKTIDDALKALSYHDNENTRSLKAALLKLEI